MEKCTWVSEYNFVVFLSTVFVPFGSYLIGRQTVLFSIRHSIIYSIILIQYYFPVAFFPSQFFGNNQELTCGITEELLNVKLCSELDKCTFNTKLTEPVLLV